MTPASLVSVTDPYLSYCLNEACWSFGGFVEGKLDEVKGKTSKEREGRRKLVLKKILEAEGADQMFAAPTATK